MRYAHRSLIEPHFHKVGGDGKRHCVQEHPGGRFPYQPPRKKEPRSERGGTQVENEAAICHPEVFTLRGQNPALVPDHRVVLERWDLPPLERGSDRGIKLLRGRLEILDQLVPVAEHIVHRSLRHHDLRVTAHGVLAKSRRDSQPVCPSSCLVAPSVQPGRREGVEERPGGAWQEPPRTAAPPSRLPWESRRGKHTCANRFDHHRL